MPGCAPFKRTYIEITNACNLSCAFCPRTTRPAAWIRPRQFETILDKLGRHSGHICLHVTGEPLLHPQIKDLLDIASAHKKPVNLTTNGTLVDRLCPFLDSTPALRLITFSLQSFEGMTQAMSVDDYLDPIFRCIRSASGRHLMRLRMWEADTSPSSDVRLAMVAAIEKEFSLDFDLEKKLGSCDSVRLDTNVFLNQTRRFDWPDKNGRDFGTSGFCLGLRSQIAVLVDGTVVPCCLDRNGDIALGNIFEQTVPEILESKRARDIYDGFSRRKVVEDLCRKCSYRLRFDRK